MELKLIFTELRLLNLSYFASCLALWGLTLTFLKDSSHKHVGSILLPL